MTVFVHLSYHLCVRRFDTQVQSVLFLAPAVIWHSSQSWSSCHASLPLYLPHSSSFSPRASIHHHPAPLFPSTHECGSARSSLCRLRGERERWAEGERADALSQRLSSCVSSHPPTPLVSACICKDLQSYDGNVEELRSQIRPATVRMTSTRAVKSRGYLHAKVATDRVLSIFFRQILQ